MGLYKQKKTTAGNRFLITINVLGSAGPMRFVVGEEEPAAAVIETALKAYTREGRLPVLGPDFGDYVLYCPITGQDSLSPLKTIGSFGVRNLMLFRKPPPQIEGDDGIDEEKQRIARRRRISRSFKSWFNKSLNLGVSSH